MLVNTTFKLPSLETLYVVIRDEAGIIYYRAVGSLTVLKLTHNEYNSLTT